MNTLSPKKLNEIWTKMVIKTTALYKGNNSSMHFYMVRGLEVRPRQSVQRR